MIILDVLTIVDLLRRHLRTRTTVGWFVLIVVLPLVGPMIYFTARRPDRGAAEQAYLADADRRARAANDPYDRAGF